MFKKGNSKVGDKLKNMSFIKSKDEKEPKGVVDSVSEEVKEAKKPGSKLKKFGKRLPHSRRGALD